MTDRIWCTLNGHAFEGTARDEDSLVDFLRREAGLPGTREGCGLGECGSCTVLLDGRAVCACLMPAMEVEGRSIVTIEGLGGAGAGAGGGVGTVSGAVSGAGAGADAGAGEGEALGAADGALAPAAGGLSPLQQAFVEKGGIQCGFCSPGMILAAYALLQRDPNPPPEAIRTALAGNLCRCTGYVQIVEAVQHAAWLLAEERAGAGAGAADGSSTASEGCEDG